VFGLFPWRELRHDATRTALRRPGFAGMTAGLEWKKLEGVGRCGAGLCVEKGCVAAESRDTTQLWRLYSG